MPVSLTLIRAHLNLDADTDTELLTHYRDAGEAWVAAYVGAPFSGSVALMVQAVLLLVAHQYESREAVIFGNAYQLPFGVTDLLSPLKDRVTGLTSAEITSLSSAT